jgi:hypothetical protein
MRLAVAIILAAFVFHADAAVVKIWNNFATTNAPAAATNVVKSLATNVVQNAPLPAANLTGSVADARLSANVALKDAENVFTASNSIAGAFTGNGAGLTNLAAGTTYASNVISGGVLPMGTVSASTATAGYVLATDGTLRQWTNRVSLARVDGLGGLGSTNLVTGRIVSTNANVANTQIVINGAQNGVTGNVIDYSSNNVSVFSVNSSGRASLGSGGNLIGAPSSRFYDIYSFANLISVAGTSGGYAIEPGATISGSAQAVGIFGDSSAAGGMRVMRVNGGTVSGFTNLSAGNFTANGLMRVTNSVTGNYTDIGADGAVTNVNLNGGGLVMLTNAAAAGTYTYIQSPSNGVNVKVFGSVSNSVETSSITSAGVVTAPTMTASGTITGGAVTSGNNVTAGGASSLILISRLSIFSPEAGIMAPLGSGLSYFKLLFGGVNAASGLAASTNWPMLVPWSKTNGNNYAELDLMAGTNQTEFASFKANQLYSTNATGNTVVITNGAVNASTFFSLLTNYVAANFVPVAGQVKVASSNGALYSITQLSTNLISGP